MLRVTEATAQSKIPLMVEAMFYHHKIWCFINQLQALMIYAQVRDKRLGRRLQAY
jgi:hypothetical protein